MGENIESNQWKMKIYVDGEWIELGEIINLEFGDIRSIKREEAEEMKIVEVVFQNSKEPLGPCSKGFVFSCANDIFLKLRIGSKVVVDTRYGLSIAIVTRLDVKNPEVTPYKSIVSIVPEEAVKIAKEQESYLMDYYAKKKRKERLDELNYKMTRFIGEFTPEEVCTALAGCNPVMHKLWIEAMSLSGESERDIRKSMSERHL